MSVKDDLALVIDHQRRTIKKLQAENDAMKLLLKAEVCPLCRQPKLPLEMKP